MVAVVTDLNRQKINEYIWTVYVENQKAPFELDESEALHFFERFYAKHPINEDDECFYYGVLLYEQAFVDEPNRDRYLVKAQEVFRLYRELSGETEWDVVEDRLEDVSQMIKDEDLLSKVKTAAETAPEIPGMVLVPPGAFLFGEDNRETLLEPYYIDIYPVTNKHYREFLEETKYRSPRIWETNPEVAADDMPVTGVSWMDALQYCKWAGKSLPTNHQWEKAARGTQGYTYPWGEDELTPERANYLYDVYREPELKPVTAFESYGSPFGCKVMVGTVWEWTNTPYPDEEGACYIKGGSFVDPDNEAFISTTATLWAGKKAKTDILGFRCTKVLELT